MIKNRMVPVAFLRSLLMVVAAASAGLADITFVTNDTINVTQSGRKIMLDGFLLEWNTLEARPWGGDTAWQWSAMTTPEGPAGYLMVSGREATRRWRITFEGPMFEAPLVVSLPPDSGLKPDGVRIDVTGSDSTPVCVIEWLFPWPTSHEPGKPVCMTFRAVDENGNTRPDIVVCCTAAAGKRNVWKGVQARGLFIGLLVFLYFIVQRQLRRQTVRKESPRQ